jgi:hypothetical protein
MLLWIIKFFIIVFLCTSIIRSICPTIGVQTPEECYKYHDVQFACCYQEVYDLNYVGSRSCVSAPIWDSGVAIIQTTSRTTVRDCGDYQSKFAQDFTYRCGISNPQSLIDCNTYSNSESKCCLQTVVSNTGQINKFCFYSGARTTQIYRNFWKDFKFEVVCGSNYLYLSLIYILFLYMFMCI